MTSDVPAASGIRISDAEREHVAERLRQAMTEGRLTLEEADERQAAAYAARFRSDLTPLIADLPDPPRPPARPLDRTARSRLAVHGAIVAVLAVLLVLGWVGSSAPFFWPAWPMFWLALSLFVHARILRRRAAVSAG